jgi:hypothetical protein
LIKNERKTMFFCSFLGRKTRFLGKNRDNLTPKTGIFSTIRAVFSLKSVPFVPGVPSVRGTVRLTIIVCRPSLNYQLLL